MLILLPPSEGKTAARSRRPVDLAGLCLPALTGARERVLDALVTLCAADDPEPARAALGLSVGQLSEVRRNAALRRAPALPAGRLYTGVLYDALGLDTLDPAARRLVRRWSVIFSGLWGVLRLDDRVPVYRCPIGASLPGVGPLTGHWRAALAPALTDLVGGGPVLDLRSAAYAAAWRPAGPAARRTLAVRVLQERVVAGVPRRSVVSHFNKATKGRLVRDLAAAGARPRSVPALVAALRDLKYTVEEPAPGRLDVIVAEP